MFPNDKNEILLIKNISNPKFNSNWYCYCLYLYIIICICLISIILFMYFYMNID